MQIYHLHWHCKLWTHFMAERLHQRLVRCFFFSLSVRGTGKEMHWAQQGFGKSVMPCVIIFTLKDNGPSAVVHCVLCCATWCHATQKCPAVPFNVDFNLLECGNISTPSIDPVAGHLPWQRPKAKKYAPSWFWFVPFYTYQWTACRRLMSISATLYNQYMAPIQMHWLWTPSN